MRETKTGENIQETTPPEVNTLSPNAPLTQNTHESPRDIEGLRHEYTEVITDIRHYSNLRFAIFTLFFAALGGLVSAAFGFFEVKSGNPEHVKLLGRVGGLLVTLVFFLYELRIQSLINHSFKIGKQLEEELRYYHISLRPNWKWYRSHHVTIAFFVILIGFWLWLLFFPPA